MSAMISSTKHFGNLRYLSVMGFDINIDTLMGMIPQLLEKQQYVLTYRFSQDHLELLFNSIRASGLIYKIR